MKLMELLREDLIKVGLESGDKWAAITELVDVLVDRHEVRLHDRNRLLEAVIARERSMSTGLERELAIPHATSELVPDLVGVLGIAPAGIPFDSLDGRPTRVILLLLVPRERYGQHLKTLKGIASLTGNADFRKKLVAAASPAEALRLIITEEEKLED